MSILLQKTDLSDILKGIKQVSNNNWIAWIHWKYIDFKIDYNWTDKDISDKLLDRRNEYRTGPLKCCDRCAALESCHFPEHNMPTNPVPNDPGLLHPNCHCRKENMQNPIVGENVWAHCALSKFNNYIFNPSKINGKENLFIEHGYTIEDSEYLRDEYIRQAAEKYIDGDFTFHKLDMYGQVIDIEIDLNGWIVITGWMVEPNGHIRCTSPFPADKHRKDKKENNK